MIRVREFYKTMRNSFLSERKVHHETRAWSKMRSSSCEIEDGAADHLDKPPSVTSSTMQEQLRVSLFLKVCKAEMELGCKISPRRLNCYLLVGTPLREQYILSQ
jgi:hypothetical protein